MKKVPEGPESPDKKGPEGPESPEKWEKVRKGSKIVRVPVNRKQLFFWATTQIFLS